DVFHDLLRAHHPRPPEAFRLRQSSLHIGYPDVEGHVTGIALWTHTDAAADSGAVAAGHDPVVHRIVGVDLPPEQVRVERPQPGAVLADDLEVHYWPCHGVSFPTMSGVMTPALRKTHRDQVAGTMTRPRGGRHTGLS